MLKRLFFSVMVVFFCTNLFAGNPFGNALHLNGNQQYFEIPDRAYMNIEKPKNCTLELWFKPYSSEQFNIVNKLLFEITTSDVIIFQGWYVDLNRSHFRWVNNIQETPIASNPFVQFLHPGSLLIANAFISEGKWHSSLSFSYEEINTQVWQHLTIVFNNSESMKCYLDDKYSIGSEIRGDMGSPGHPLNIGGLPIAIDTTLDISLYFNGLIDEVRIWSVARTEYQIQSTMNDTLSPLYYSTPDSGLVAYYRFEQMENLGIGGYDLPDDIRDLSYNANHGDLIGNPDLLDSDILTSVETEILDIPESYEILRNYPNPFNPWTTLFYRVPKSTLVTLKVYDILGKEIETLVREHQPEGEYEITWNAKDLPSGLYICRLQTEGLVKSLKMLLQR